MSGQSAEWHIGDVIDGRYEVTGLLGAGGMGTVHKVRHLGWGIDLAVKSPKPGWFSAKEDVHRFVAEAQTWVKLGLHPNVCGCHYVRELDGIPRLFAEYVPGGSLRERIDDGSLYAGDPVRVTARLLRMASQMASGLEHAHSQEVLHRDVKPANVLLDDSDTGDDGNSGGARITDFGLAYARAAATRNPGDTATLAAPANGLMTPAYASPEQARGEPVGRRSDIYSFAVSVLDMFSGGVSWGPGAAGAFLAQLPYDDALPDGVPVMPEGLARLLKRCLHDNHRDRPESMAEVAGELAIVCSTVAPDAPLLPAMPGPVELRAAEHNNRAVSLLDLGDRDQAEKEFRVALDVDPQHLDALYNSGLLRWRQGLITDDDLLADMRNASLHTSRPRHVQLLLAHVHAERGDIQTARGILEDLVREQGTDPDASRALSALRSLGTGTEASQAVSVSWYGIQGSRNTPFERFRFSRDGTHAVTGTDTGGCLLWDLSLGDDPRRLWNGRMRSCEGDSEGMVTFHPDVTADRSRGTGFFREEHARVWDFTTGRSLHLYPPDVRLGILAMRVAPDGSRAYGITRNGELVTWNLVREPLQPRGAVLARVQIGAEGVTGRWALLDVNADGSVLLAAVDGTAGQYRLARLTAGTARRPVLDDSLARVRAMAMTSAGDVAVTAHDDHQVKVWDLGRGEVRQEITSSGGITALAVSDDARWALSGGEDSVVRVWDLASGRCQQTLHGHHDIVCAVWISADGRFGRSAGNDDTVRSWSLRPAPYQAPLQISQPYGAAQVRRVGDRARSLIGQAENAMGFADYPAAVCLLDQVRAVSGYERSPRLRGAWRELSRILPQVGLRGVWSAHVLPGERPPDIEFFVGISADATVGVSGHGEHACLWDLERGTRLRELPIGAFAASLTSGGDRIVYATLEDTIEVCSVATGTRLRSLAPSSEDVLTSVSATADGTRVLLGYRDGALQFWDTDAGRCLRSLPRHDAGIRATWIDPAGSVAVSGGDDAVRMWDPHSGECLLEIPVSQRTLSVCASPGTGKIVVTRLARQGMRMWNSRGEIVHEFDEQPAGIATAAFSPEGRFIVAGDDQGSISVWDSGTGRCIHTIEGHRDAVWDMRLTPDGCYALSGSLDGMTRLWELEWELATSR